MRFNHFLDKFVPKASTPTPDVRYNGVKNAKTESDMSKKLLRGMNRVLEQCVAVNSSNHPDRHSADGQKIRADFLVYSAMVDLLDGSTQFNKALLGGEEKFLVDPFNDDAAHGGFEPLLDEKNSVIVGQVLRYIEEMHARQDRVFSFFIFLNVDYFRVIRADRDGLIVTEQCAWSKKDPKNKFQCLNEFLHRFDNLSPKEQGFDTTIREVSSDNAEHAERAREHLQKHISEKLQHHPIREIDVPCAEAQNGFRTFYVWAATTDSRGLRTRATRGYPAWDPEKKAVVFIKDSWRSDRPGVQREADVIARLNKEKVRNAPKLICGGDVLDQRTVTHLYIDNEWNRGQRLEGHPRVHHRLAENFGVPLWKFKSSKHLMQILLDSMICHRQALEKCQTLHCDISAQNILWDEKKQKGFLSDWDLCAKTPAKTDDPEVNMLAEIPDGTGRPDRTGTWAYMSVLSLEQKTKLHDVQDDLESLFWVGVYIIIFYFPCDEGIALSILDDALLQYSVQYNRDSARPIWHGGTEKRLILDGSTSSVYAFTLADSVSSPLMEWFHMYRVMLDDWVSYKKQMKRWEEQQEAEDAANGEIEQLPTQQDLTDASVGIANEELTDAGTDVGSVAQDEENELDKDAPDESSDDDASDESEEEDSADEDSDTDVKPVNWRPKPDAPALRDYKTLEKAWRKLVEHGKFKDNDRLMDDLHESPPEVVIAAYRQRVKERTTKAIMKQAEGKARLSASQQHAGTSRSTTLGGTSTSEAASDANEEEDVRAAKRRKTSAPEKPSASRPTQQRVAGGKAKGKARR